MSKSTNSRRIWLLLVIASSCWLLVHSLRYNWTLHARLNLLLRGYVFSHLESPTQVNGLPAPRQMEFVSKLVYKSGVYVGYLNTYGEFRSASDTGNVDLLNAQFVTTNVALF